MTKRVSVRLDDDALRALRRLQAAGLSRSDAIRKALVDTQLGSVTGRRFAQRYSNSRLTKKTVGRRPRSRI